VYGVDTALAENYRALVERGDEEAISSLLAASSLENVIYVTDEAPERFPIHAISIAVAQKCNLGCVYCYAKGGDFGSEPKNMPLEIALKAVDNLVSGVEPGEKVNIAFLGGEPLVNRPVLQAATEHAAARGAARGVKVNFSITTNGTLLAPEDAAFFEHHGFAVTISLDGVGDAHDRQRAYRNGRGSYDTILRRVEPLLRQQKRMQVSARVTVTPDNLFLRQTLDHFIATGFFSVGFSPMLSSPTGQGEMDRGTLDIMLEQMIDCGRAFEAHLIAGRRYPFLNMVNALKEIHKGTHRPYPCGAGAAYVGVSAEGGYFACHRFVDDAAGAMGTLETGVDAAKQARWLAQRHVHAQEPCSSCWARYLCGGGCHHEVIHRGRPACDYIRGWLAYCLASYVRLSAACPQFFTGGEAPSTPPPDHLGKQPKATAFAVAADR
ncbi:MAG: radical SAM protein, partial [Bradyrhizobium sp.]